MGGGGRMCEGAGESIKYLLCVYIHTYIYTHKDAVAQTFADFCVPPPLPKGKKKEKKRKEPCHKSLHISYSE